MQSLTERQREILFFIKEEIREKGYPPSVREIGEAVGLSSSSTVHGHMIRLAEKGYIRRDPTKPRAIEVLDEARTNHRKVMNIPLLGRVAAGAPILADDQVEAWFPLPVDFVSSVSSDLFMLTVQGDSMVEAGIFDGDLILVRHQQHATNGEIVVALIEDEATVKRFYKESGCIRLQPENRFMDPIIVPDVRIAGKVVGLVRRMRDEPPI